MTANPAAFRERTLARLRGEVPAAAAKPAPVTHKQKLNKVRNDQRQKALTPWQWRKAVEHWGRVCVYCGKEAKKLQKEHFWPIELGGTLERWNVVPACQKCNNGKGSRSPLEWMVEKGWLVRYVEIAGYLEGLR